MVQSRACAPGLCVCVGNMSYYDKVSTCSDNQGDLPGRRSLLVKEELELFAWWPDRYFPLYLTYKFLPKAIRKAEGKCAFHVITHLVHPSDSSQISQPWQRSSSEAALSPRKVLLSLCLGFCLGIDLWLNKAIRVQHLSSKFNCQDLCLLHWETQERLHPCIWMRFSPPPLFLENHLHKRRIL